VLPFQTWEWTVAWWQHLRADRFSVRDALRVYVVRDEMQRAIAIAPMILTERPTFGPLRSRHLQFIGADPNITEIRTMLCAPGYERDCASTLRAHLLKRRFEWDWMSWEAGPGVSRPSVRPDKHAYVLELAPSWSQMRGRFRRNIKESLRRCYNSLRRDNLSARLEVLDTPGCIDAALPEFFRLHAERAAVRRGAQHPDVFASPDSRAFLSEVCSRLAARGAAKVFRLWIEDRVVATRVGFQLGGMLYLYYSGWDLSFARYSVMTTLVAEILRYAIQAGLSRVHLSTGNDVAKTRWGPAEITYSTEVALSPRRLARTTYVVYSAAKRVGESRLGRALTPGYLVRGARSFGGPREESGVGSREPGLGVGSRESESG
jgi:hypothetical protein